MSFKVTLNQENLHRVIEWIAVADRKAVGLLALWTVAVTGFGVTIDNTAGKLLASPFSIGSILIELLSLCFIFSAFCTVVVLTRVIHPRNRDLNRLDSPLYGESMVKLREEDFLKKMEGLDEAVAAEHLAKQTYALQQVCTSKYSDLQRSRLPLLLSIIFLMLYLIGKPFL